MIDKAPDAYRTISEVADELDLPQHVLRFWETRFGQIKPLKRGGGRRYYRPDDVELLSGIRHLLYSEGYTIKGVQRILKEQGPKAVQAFAKAVPSAGHASEPAVVPAIPVVAQPVVSPLASQIVAPPPVPPVIAAPPSVAQSLAPPVAREAVELPVQPVQKPFVAPLAPAFPPERPYSLPTGAEQRLGAPVYMPENESFAVDDAAAAIPLPDRAPQPTTAPSVSYMRGGLSRPAQPMPESPIAPQPAQTFRVRRTIKPTPPQELSAPRYSPLVEPDLGDALEPAQIVPAAARAGLTEEARRSLQAALFELSECRRSIENIIAARVR